MLRPTLRALAVAAVCLAAALAACKPPPPPEPAAREPVRAENAALKLAYADVLDGWRVAVNEGEELRLERIGPEGGAMWLELREEQRAGVNLVKEVNDWKARYDEMPGGKFFGQIEIGSPLGTAYHVRGRYEEDGVLKEELRILAIYPHGNRLLTAVYSYPAGEDTQERVNDHLFPQFGELEAIYPQTSE